MTHEYGGDTVDNEIVEPPTHRERRLRVKMKRVGHKEIKCLKKEKKEK